MTERWVTIFLTSHVLEIVERLCSHVAIIHKGRLVDTGIVSVVARSLELIISLTLLVFQS